MSIKHLFDKRGKWVGTRRKPASEVKTWKYLKTAKRQWQASKLSKEKLDSEEQKFFFKNWEVSIETLQFLMSIEGEPQYKLVVEFLESQEANILWEFGFRRVYPIIFAGQLDLYFDVIDLSSPTRNKKCINNISVDVNLLNKGYAFSRKGIGGTYKFIHNGSIPNFKKHLFNFSQLDVKKITRYYQLLVRPKKGIFFNLNAEYFHYDYYIETKNNFPKGIGNKQYLVGKRMMLSEKHAQKIFQRKKKRLWESETKTPAIFPIENGETERRFKTEEINDDEY
jgi:hypothetical protein